VTAPQAAPKPPRPYKPPTHVRYWEAGYDVAMHNVGRLVLDLRQEGLSDADEVDAVLSMAQLRMMTGAENPVELLAEDSRT
jgi:hypothetical protein